MQSMRIKKGKLEHEFCSRACGWLGGIDRANARCAFIYLAEIDIGISVNGE